MKFGVVVFPGSNCDADAYYAIKDILKQPVEYIWHQTTNVDGFDCIILPGGFSYGDYLRTGAVAKFSPVMEAVSKFANDGGKLIGICNGFQVLCEAHLLPGALISNTELRFICKYINLSVTNNKTTFTNKCKDNQVLRIPIAHHGGNYFAEPDTIKKIENNNQIILKYCDAQGNISDSANPNGSINNIAGIINEKGNVAGMMPHPERAVESVLGSEDGRFILESLLEKVF